MSGQVFAPAVLDKVYAGLNAKIKASKPIIQKLFAAGMAAGEATQHGQSAKVPWLAAAHAACPPPQALHRPAHLLGATLCAREESPGGRLEAEAARRRRSGACPRWPIPPPLPLPLTSDL